MSYRNAGIPALEDRAERWLRRHGWVAPALLSLTAAMAYVPAAASCYFNPDEAWKISVADAPTWSAAMSEASRLMHPPLLTALLRGLLAFGSAEWLLRLPSMLFALGALWLVWAWLRRTAGDAAAVAATAFLAASPAMVSAASEVREYAGLVFFSVAALYGARRFVEAPSRGWLTSLTVALAAGFLTHHATAWVAVALGVYVPLELRRRGAARSCWIAWSMCQAALVALAAWTVFGYGDEYIAGARGDASKVPWVQAGFPRQGEGAAGFVFARIFAIWGRAIGSDVAGAVGLLLFVVGLANLVVARKPTAGGVSRRHEALLVAVPFVVGAAVGWAGVYPFGPLRHTDFVLPFAAAGLGVGVATLVRLRVARVALAAILVLPIWFAVTGPANDPAVLSRENLDAALDALDHQIPEGAPVIVDNQMLYVLLVYWRDRDPVQVSAVPPTWRFGSREIVSAPWAWKLRPRNMERAVLGPARRLGREVGESVWIASLGWGPVRGLVDALPPRFRLHDQRFGEIAIQEIRLVPPPDGDRRRWRRPR